MAVKPIQRQKAVRSADRDEIRDCGFQVSNCIENGRNTQIEQEVIIADRIQSILIRILGGHPIKGYCFVVFEECTDITENILSESKWKNAIDAAGDGVVEANYENGTILFSDKWFEIFGYERNQVATLEQC